MERFHSERARELFPAAGKLISHALQFSAEEMVDLVSEWRAAHVRSVSVSTASIVTEIVCQSLHLENDFYVSKSQSFLLVGIEDIERIITEIRSQHPEQDTEALLATMSDPETIQTIAFLALRSGMELYNYTLSKLGETGTLAQEGTAYTINDDYLAIESRGCPAAGYVSTSTAYGEVAPLAIFKRFVPWAAKIHLLSGESSFKTTLKPLMLEK